MNNCPIKVKTACLRSSEDQFVKVELTPAITVLNSIIAHKPLLTGTWVSLCILLHLGEQNFDLILGAT